MEKGSQWMNTQIFSVCLESWQSSRTTIGYETQGPQQVNKDGSVQPGSSILYCQPFSTTDLLNWKQRNPAYSDKP